MKAEDVLGHSILSMDLMMQTQQTNGLFQSSNTNQRNAD